MKRSIMFRDSSYREDSWLFWCVFVLGALLFALAVARVAGAATIYDWDNWSGNSEFHDANNWRPGGGPPGAVDSAIFDGQLENLGIGNNGVHVLPGTAITDMQVIDTAIVDLTIGNGTPSSQFRILRSLGDGLTLGNSFGDTATLNLLGGWLDTYRTVVAGRATINVINAGSYWDSADVLISGDTTTNTAGIGLALGAQILTQGNLDIGSDTGSGRVVVDGTVLQPFDPRPLWTVASLVDVGPTSTTGFNFGLLTVQDGGRMNVQNDFSVHGTSEATSKATVRTGGELTVTDLLQIGSYGTLELFDATSKITTGRFSKTGTGGTFDWTAGTLEITSDHLILDNATPDSVFGHDLTVGTGQQLIVSQPDANNSLDIGLSGTGSLTIQSGGVVESYRGTIGVYAGGNGTVLVHGAGSTWITHEGLRVGQQETAVGLLNVRSSATVHSAGWITLGLADQARGTAIVENLGRLSTDMQLHVGYGGSTVGSLTVRRGGEVSVSDLLNVTSTSGVALSSGGSITAGSFIVQPGGIFIHEDGTLTVNGGQFTMEAGQLLIDSDAGTPIVRLQNGAQGSVPVPAFGKGVIKVGADGHGRLEILSGATLTSSTGWIASGNAAYPGAGVGHVLVQGEDSLWQITGDAGGGAMWSHPLEVGENGAGTLEIRDRGHVVIAGAVGIGSPFLYVTNGQGGPGTAIVDGQDSLLRVTPDLLSNPGHLAVGTLSSSTGASGFLTVSNGGRVEVEGNLVVQDAGTVTLASGGEIHTDSFIVEPGGTLQGSGIVSLAASGSLNNAGVVAPVYRRV